MKGDVVLIFFPFTDLTGNKLWPAIVLIETALDLAVCFITTQLRWKDPTDVELIPSITNGVKKASLIRLSKNSYRGQKVGSWNNRKVGQ